MSSGINSAIFFALGIVSVGYLERLRGGGMEGAHGVEVVHHHGQMEVGDIVFAAAAGVAQGFGGEGPAVAAYKVFHHQLPYRRLARGVALDLHQGIVPNKSPIPH